MDGLNPEQRQYFNLGVDLYTELLFEQKELAFRIIETSYSKGYEAAIKEIEWARINAIQQAQQELQEQELQEQRKQEIQQEIEQRVEQRESRPARTETVVGPAKVEREQYMAETKHAVEPRTEDTKTSFADRLKNIPKR
jgi:hypothetical protein